MERGARTARWCAWAVWTSAHVSACGHAGRRFFAGFSKVDSSGCPLHYGMFKNTFGELGFLSLDQTPSLSRTSSDTSCWVIQAIKHTHIYVVRQLAYSTELLVCINQAWKQYKQQNKEEEKNSLLNSTLPSSLSLCFSLVLLILRLSVSISIYKQDTLL
jgi:hypothetical protein